MIPRQAIGQFSQVDPPEYADANPQVCDIVTCIWEAGLVIIHARNFVRSETRHHYALVCLGVHIGKGVVCRFPKVRPTRGLVKVIHMPRLNSTSPSFPPLS